MLSVDYEEGDYGSYKGACIEHYETGISFNMESEGPLDDLLAIEEIGDRMGANGFIVLATSSWNDFILELMKQYKSFGELVASIHTYMIKETEEGVKQW